MESTTMPPRGEIATDKTDNLVSADKVVGSAVTTVKANISVRSTG